MFNPIYQGQCKFYLDENEIFSISECTFHLNGQKLIGYVDFKDWEKDLPKSMEFLNQPVHKVELDNGNSAYFIFDPKPPAPYGEFSLRYSSGITGQVDNFFIAPHK